MRLVEEGHEVELCILDKKCQKTGENMIPKIKDWRSAISKDKVIVFDSVGMGNTAGVLKKQGYHVFGGHPFGDKIELDRTFGTDFMHTAGIHTPKTQSFTNFDKAIEMVKKSRQRYVFKPNGNMGCELTYVAFNDEDMIYLLESFKKRSDFKKIEFEMQSLQKGVEVSCEGLFDGKDWVDGWFNITMERKRELYGDLGKNTGCALDVVRVLKEQRESPMVKKTLLKITNALREIDYRGFIDINCIYFNGTPFGLEWTPRFGINAFLTLTELVKNNLGEVFSKIAMGEPLKADLRQHLFSASVRVSIPKIDGLENRMIQKISHFKHIWPMYIKIDECGRLVATDEDNNILVITESAPDIMGAANKVYDVINTCENFGIMDICYRKDCGVQAEEVYNTLKRWQLVKEY